MHYFWPSPPDRVPSSRRVTRREFPPSAKSTICRASRPRRETPRQRRKSAEVRNRRVSTIGVYQPRQRPAAPRSAASTVPDAPSRRGVARSAAPLLRLEVRPCVSFLPRLPSKVPRRALELPRSCRELPRCRSVLPRSLLSNDPTADASPRFSNRDPPRCFAPSVPDPFRKKVYYF